MRTYQLREPVRLRAALWTGYNIDEIRELLGPRQISLVPDGAADRDLYLVEGCTIRLPLGHYVIVCGDAVDTMEPEVFEHHYEEVR